MVHGKKVLAGGVFNTIHPGHLYFLKKAKALGDKLVVVVATDKTAGKKRIQKKLYIKAVDRARLLRAIKFIDKVLVGGKIFTQVIKKEMPDFIAVGHDQNVAWIRDYIRKNKLKIKVVRIPRYKNYSSRRFVG